MKSFKEFSSNNIEERYSDIGIGIELMKSVLPKPILHYLKRVLHKDQYKIALKLQKGFMKNRSMSSGQAIVTAASVVGISSRELQKVLDKETRHK